MNRNEMEPQNAQNRLKNIALVAQHKMTPDVPVWMASLNGMRWVQISGPKFDSDVEYVISHEKPSWTPNTPISERPPNGN